MQKIACEKRFGSNFIRLLYFLMMPFFNRNWAEAWRGRWAGPGSLVG